MPLQRIDPSFPVDDYAVPEKARTGCVQTAQPGVLAFRDVVRAAYGGGVGGIVRPCTDGAESEHFEGRAWDWPMSATDPAEASRVEALLAELLAPDARGQAHAMFRRAGLRYLIWNRRLWSVRNKNWVAYDSPPHPSPHTDHVHFSFGWPGALAQTSLYAALGVKAERTPVAVELAEATGPVAVAVVALAVMSGVGLGMLVAWRL